MNPSTHALVGKTLGALVRRPAAALACGILSHALLDFLPHRDSKSAGWRAVDAGLTLSILASAFLSSDAELAGAIGAIVPDLENAADLWRPAGGRKFFPSHQVSHRRGPVRFRIATELLVVATALLAGAIAPAPPN